MGSFVVSRRQDDNRDILFQPNPQFAGPIPDDHLALKDEIERALTVLHALYPQGGPGFERYFLPLLSLAQVGLAMQSPQPAVAQRALAMLKQQVVAWEGGTIKNRYMKYLGTRALLLAMPAGLVAALVAAYMPTHALVAHFLVLWTGCMAGVWLSFGARKTIWTFDDLHIPEQDRLEPLVRLVFAGLLTIIIGLSFSTEALVVRLGVVSTTQINDNFRVALLIGMLCGFSEQALSSKVAKQATTLLDIAQ